MLVDDSAIVRGLITRALTESPDIEVVASAINGVLAIPLAKQYQPDVIVLDIEMPEMDGLTALPKLLEAAPKSKIIMASTLTLRNAGISMQALSLGASDYVPKPSARAPEELAAFYRELKDKIHALARPRPAITPAPAPVVRIQEGPPVAPVQALAIACSTGGPQALMRLFGDLKGKLRHIPIFITQHMPPTFTTILAENLSKTGERPCIEGKDGEEPRPGHAYIAPGNYHMLVLREGGKIVIRLNQNPPVNFCRPAADPMFNSLSIVYGRHLLAAVLTGMGQDGTEGARAIVAAGGSVIAQDEASSVVWSMPKAAASAGLCRAVLPIQSMGGYIAQQVGG